jgi:hypothetical protein
LCHRAGIAQSRNSLRTAKRVNGKIASYGGSNTFVSWLVVINNMIAAIQKAALSVNEFAEQLTKLQQIEKDHAESIRIPRHSVHVRHDGEHVSLPDAGTPAGGDIGAEPVS